MFLMTSNIYFQPIFFQTCDCSSPRRDHVNPRLSRVSRPHLKHILNKCYNKSVKDPNELNNYEAFTPEVSALL